MRTTDLLVGFVFSLLMCKGEASASEASFDFSFPSITIYNTRSRHSDTDFAFLSVKIGTRTYPVEAKKLGDLNNGSGPKEFQVNLAAIGIKIPDDSTPVEIKWSVINSGHAPAEQYQRLLNTGGSAAIHEIPNAGAAAVIKTIFQLGTSLLFANCDGSVVDDHWTGNGHQLFQYTSPGNGLGVNWTSDGAGNAKYVAHDPGSDSPHGCGSNSKYSSTIRISRH